MDDLRALEEQYRTLLECLPDQVMTVGADGRILSLNRSYIGLSVGDIVGHTVFDFTVDEDCPKLRDALDRVFRGEIVSVVARGRSEPTTWWQSRLGPIRRDGRVEAALWVTNNVTDLVDRDSRYAILVEQSSEGIFIADPTGRFVDVNPKGCAMLGYSREELLQRTIRDISAPEELERQKEHLAEVLAGRIITMPRRLRRKDGGIFHAEITARRMATGQLLGLVRDISERIRIEEALRESEERQRLVIERALDGVIVMSDDGRVRIWNRQAEIIFGWTREEALGRPLAELIIPPDQREAHQRGLERYREGAPNHMLDRRVELTALTKDGREIPVELSVTALPGGLFSAFVRDITDRRRSEQAIRESEERFRIVVRATNEMIWDIDLLTGRVWRNEAISTLGYVPGECEPTTDWLVERIHPEDRERVRRKVEDAIAQGLQSWSAEYRIRRKDGTYATILDRGFILRDAEGRPVRMTGAALDISERLRSEQALRESEERFRRAFTSSGTGMALVRPDGTFFQVNSAFCRMTGYTEEEVTGRTFASLTHPEDLASSLDAARRMLAGEIQLLSLEKRYLSKDGRVIWMILTTSLMRDPSGQPLYFISQFQDITRRHEAEEALRRSEERFQLVTRATNDAIWDWDLLTNAVWWNDAVGSLFDYRPDEIRGGIEWWRERIHPEDRPRVTAAIDEAIGTECSAWQDEYRFRRGDETYAQVFDRGFIIRAPDGRPIRMIGSMMDITDLKEAEAALRRQTHLYETLLQAQSDVDEGFVLAEGGRMLYVNDAFQRLTGYTPEELHAMPSFLELLPPEHRAAAEERQRRRDAGLPVEDRSETAIVHRSGRRVEIEVAVKTYEQDGRLRSVVICRDITERKRAREELERRVEERTRELRLQTTLLQTQSEASLDGILLVGTDGRILHHNRRFAEMWGMPEHLLREVYDEGLLRAAAPQVQDAQRWLERVRWLYEHPEEESRDEIRLRDGRIIDRYSAPIRDRDGRYHGRVWYFRDITAGHRAEQALRESEERFRQLAENIGEVFWMVKADYSEMLYTNPAIERVWGRPASEIMSDPKGFLGAVHPEDRPRVEAGLSKQALGSYEIEYRILRPDGTMRWIHDRAFPVRNERGEVYRLAGIAEDVTERKRAQEALQKLAEEQGLLLAHTRDFVYRHDTRGVFSYVSPAIESITGYTVQDWLQHYTTFLTANPINKKAIAYTEETLRTGRQSPPYLLEVRHKSGRPILLEVNERAYFEGTRIAGIIGVARDVTERERAQEALRESERKYGELIREAPDAIILLDAIGRYVEANPAAERILGMPLDQILGRHFRDLGVLTKESLAKSEEEFGRLIAGEERRPFEIEVESRSGRWILEANPRLIRRSGEAAFVQVTFRDVTARKSAEEEVRRAADATRRAYEALKRTQHMLIQAEKLASVGMVMAGIAHEINNPLNVIYGNLRLLEEHGPKDPRKIRQMLRDARTASENARRVVEEFRHFARDTGVAEPVPLRLCIEEALEQVRPLLGRKVKVLKKFGNVPPVRVFRGQIRRAVQNVLKNAVESMEGKGTIRIVMKRRGDHAVLDISDTGRGISKEHLGRIFEPFFTTKEHGKGFGLGLALCAAVVQNHGGRIGVKSTLGKGTSFTIRLPLKS